MKKLLPLLVGLVVSNLLHAQYVTTSSTNSFTSPADFEFRTNAIVIAKGGFSGVQGSGSLSGTDLGSGTRMMWFSGLAAFRAGRVTGTEWDDSSTSTNIGRYSAAFGLNTMANGDYSTVGGYLNSASGSYSLSFNYGNTAAGVYSAALGYVTFANGNSSFSCGRATIADGDYTSSFGNSTRAYACNSAVFGRYNQGAAICLHSSPTDETNNVSSKTVWYSGDPLLEVGNGNSSTPSDAFVVLKNGNATVQGTLTANGGIVISTNSITSADIPMLGH